MPNIPIAHAVQREYAIRLRQDIEDTKLIEMRAHLIKTEMQDAAKAGLVEIRTPLDSRATIP